jgi:CubicO group peptidase (beta-lactamase class C family)
MKWCPPEIGCSYYSSGNAHVLSAIIQETSGLNTRDFAQLYLFDPLGISDIRWKTDLDGISKGGWGMAMKPRDMAKLGYLYLNQGLWDGRQIIPAEWIAATTLPRKDISRFLNRSNRGTCTWAICGGCTKTGRMRPTA